MLWRRLYFIIEIYKGSIGQLPLSYNSIVILSLNQQNSLITRSNIPLYRDSTVNSGLDSYYSPALKKGGGYIGFGLSVIPSIGSFVRMFVRPFVCLFVRHNFCFRSISSEPFYRIYPNFVCALILT